MKRNGKVRIQCPSCDTTLEVEVSPNYPGTSSTPPEPPEILDVTDVTRDGEPGCLHYQDDDDPLYERVLEALEDWDQRLYDREMDTRMERERERRYGVGEEAEHDGG